MRNKYKDRPSKDSSDALERKLAIWIFNNGIRVLNKEDFPEWFNKKHTSISKILKLASTCSSRKEFINKYNSEYSVLRKKKKLHLLDEILPPTKERNRFQTIEDCLFEAKKYKSRNDFKRKTAYHVLRRLGGLNLLDSIFPKKLSFWDVKSAISEAKRFKTKNDFKENSPAYQWILKYHRSLINELFKNTDTKWNKTSALKAARSCSTRSEFRKKYQGACGYLENNNMMHLVYKIIPAKKRKTKYTIGKACALAKSCKNISEFARKYSAAYTLLRTNRKLLYKILPPDSRGRKSL